MANELIAGQSRVGRAWDRTIRDPYPAMLRDTGSSIELVIPYEGLDRTSSRRYIGDAVHWGDDPDRTRYDYALPEQMWFYDSKGFVSLIGVAHAGGTLGGGPTTLQEAVLRVAYAVFTGDPGIDHSSPNGLVTRIEGLGSWSPIARAEPGAETRLEGPRPLQGSQAANHSSRSGIEPGNCFGTRRYPGHHELCP